MDIGGQNTDIPVLGRYTHGRVVLSRLRYMVDEAGDETLRFANRAEEVTVRQLADRLVEQFGANITEFIIVCEMDGNGLFYGVYADWTWCTSTYSMEWNSTKSIPNGLRQSTRF